MGFCVVNMASYKDYRSTVWFCVVYMVAVESRGQQGFKLANYRTSVVVPWFSSWVLLSPLTHSS